jgi:hypothetical protein
MRCSLGSNFSIIIIAFSAWSLQQQWIKKKKKKKKKIYIYILTYLYKYLINFCYSKTSQNCKYASTSNLTVNYYMCLRLIAVHCNMGISTFCKFSLKNVTSSNVSVPHTCPPMHARACAHTHTHPRARTHTRTHSRIPLICHQWDQTTGARLPNTADYQTGPTLT